MKWWLAVIVVSCVPLGVMAAAPVALPPGPLPPGVLEQLPKETKGLLTTLIVNHLPPEHVDDRQWGKTKKIFAGWHVGHDGLRIKTKRKWKDVNHGLWRRYEIHLVKPEKHLRADLANLRTAADDQVAFDLNVSARVLVLARSARWEHGVQLYNLSAEAEADVELRMQGVVALVVDPTTLPPDVMLKPHITAAELHASRLRVKRISKADGPLVRELGDQLEGVLQRKLAEQQDRLVEKLNRGLDKHQDDLRLSLRDLVAAQWTSDTSRAEPPAASAGTR